MRRILVVKEILYAYRPIREKSSLAIHLTKNWGVTIWQRVRGIRTPTPTPMAGVIFFKFSTPRIIITDRFCYELSFLGFIIIINNF